MRSFGGFFICIWINGWVNNREVGDLRHHYVHYDVTVMGSANGLVSNKWQAITVIIGDPFIDA